MPNEYVCVCVCVRLGVVGSAETQSEDDQGSEMDSDLDRPNWQHQVGREVLAGLTPHQIKRQEVINGNASATLTLTQPQAPAPIRIILFIHSITLATLGPTKPLMMTLTRTALV